MGQCAAQIESEQCIEACLIPIWGPESSTKGFPGAINQFKLARLLFEWLSWGFRVAGPRPPHIKQGCSLGDPAAVHASDFAFTLTRQKLCRSVLDRLLGGLCFGLSQLRRQTRCPHL
jgi:hypothetical protein